MDQLTENLLLYLKLDKVNVLVDDASGNKYEGTVEGAQVAKDDQFSQCLTFNGKSDFIRCNDDGCQIKGKEPRTISIWAYVEEFNGGGLFQAGSNEAKATDFSLCTLSRENGWRIQIGSSESFDVTLKGSQGQWNHYGLVYDGERVHLYFNGILMGSKSLSLDTLEHEVCLGRWNEQYFSGKMAHFRIYKQALGAQDIQALMQAEITLEASQTTQLHQQSIGQEKVEKTEPQPKALEPIASVSPTLFLRGDAIVENENGEKIAKEESGNDHEVYVEGVKIVEDAYTNKCYEFNGTDSNLNCGSGPFQVLGKKPRSVTFWACPKSFNGGGIFQAGPTGVEGKDFSFSTLEEDNKWRVQLWGAASFDLELEESKEQWNHYAVVYDGKMVQVYYKGQLKGSKTIPLTTAPHEVWIGQWKDKFFHGKIAYLKIYTTALKEEEIEQNIKKEQEAFKPKQEAVVQETSNVTSEVISNTETKITTTTTETTSTTSQSSTVEKTLTESTSTETEETKEKTPTVQITPPNTTKSKTTIIGDGEVTSVVSSGTGDDSEVLSLKCNTLIQNNNGSFLPYIAGKEKRNAVIYGAYLAVDDHFGHCIDLNGEQQYLSCGSGPFQILGSAPRTLIAWAYTRQFNGGALFQAGASGLPARDFTLKTGDKDDEWRVQLYGSGMDLDLTLEGSKKRWCHYALVYDGTSLLVYFNGELKGSKQVTLLTCESEVTLGRWRKYYFNGKIAYLGIYNRALTSKEIKTKIANSPFSTLSPITQVISNQEKKEPVPEPKPEIETEPVPEPTTNTMNTAKTTTTSSTTETATEPSTTTPPTSPTSKPTSRTAETTQPAPASKDLSPLLLFETSTAIQDPQANFIPFKAGSDELRATLHGAKIIPDDRFGYAVDFNGKKQYLSFGKGPFQIQGDKPRTIMAWAYTRTFDRGAIFQAGAGGLAGRDFALRAKRRDSRWRVQLWGGADFDVTLPKSKENWAHYALVYDGMTVSLYFNGELKGSKKASLITCESEVTLGRWYKFYFDGKISHLSIYNRALTQEEIIQSSQSSTSTKSKPALPLPPKPTSQPTEPVQNTTSTTITTTQTQGSSCGPEDASRVLSFQPTSIVQEGSTSTVLFNAGAETLKATVYGAQLGSDERFGKYLDFNGKKQYVSFGTGPFQIQGGAPRTVIALAYTRFFNGGGIFHVGKDNRVGRDFSIRTKRRNSRFRAQLYGAADFDVTLPLSKEKWGQYVLVYDGTTAFFYFNGELKGKRKVRLLTEENEVTIGRWRNYYFNGKIACFSIYNRALTLEEIKSTYQSSIATTTSKTQQVSPPPTRILPGTSQSRATTTKTITTTTKTIPKVVPSTTRTTTTASTDQTLSQSLLLTLKPTTLITESSNTYISFSTQQGERKARVYGATLIEDEKFGHCLDFNGKQQYVSFGKGPFQIQGGAPRTLIAWAYTRTCDRGAIFRAGDSGLAGRDFALRTKRRESRWRVQLWGGADFDVTLPRSKNQWCHYALVYDGTKSFLYFNGELKASKAVRLITCESEVTLGRWHKFYFDGKIASFNIYNRALSQEEIKSALNSPIPTSVSTSTQTITRTTTEQITQPQQQPPAQVKPVTPQPRATATEQTTTTSSTTTEQTLQKAESITVEQSSTTSVTQVTEQTTQTTESSKPSAKLPQPTQEATTETTTSTTTSTAHADQPSRSPKLTPKKLTTTDFTSKPKSSTKAETKEVKAEVPSQPEQPSSKTESTTRSSTTTTSSTIQQESNSAQSTSTTSVTSTTQTNQTENWESTKIFHLSARPLVTDDGQKFVSFHTQTEERKATVIGVKVLEDEYFGHCFDFDGNGAYINCGKGPFQIQGAEPRTISFWTYNRAFDKGGVFQAGTSEGTGTDFSLASKRRDFRWRFLLSGSANYDVTLTESKDIWCHHALVYDGQNALYYFNGKLKAKKALTLNTPETELFIGRWENQYFNGKIADLRIYKRALDIDQINSLIPSDLLTSLSRQVKTTKTTTTSVETSPSTTPSVSETSTVREEVSVQKKQETIVPTTLTTQTSTGQSTQVAITNSCCDDDSTLQLRLQKCTLTKLIYEGNDVIICFKSKD